MIEENVIHEKAERIRDVIRYLRKFKNALVIIYLDDTLLDSPVFMNHIKDICLIHESGLKVIIVPGSARRINEVLNIAGVKWSIHNDCRITPPEAMPLIKMAAFDVSNQVMTALAGEKKTALIGNWVRARGKGVVNGFDYGTSGEIDKLQTDAIETVLNDGFIPIMPCIGWSVAGKPYNISSIQLAQQIASHLKADKLFYLVPGANITTENFRVPENIGLSEDGTVPAMNLEELDLFIKTNEHSVTLGDLEGSAASGSAYPACNTPHGGATETNEHSVEKTYLEKVGAGEKTFLENVAAGTNESSVVNKVNSANSTDCSVDIAYSGDKVAETNEGSVVNSDITPRSNAISGEKTYLEKVAAETNNGSVVNSGNAVGCKEDGVLTNEHSVVFKDSVSREKIYSLLRLAKTACTNGVSRVHILDGSQEGIIPCEIFSDLGSGTMIYQNNYGGIRDMKLDDIPNVMSLIQPFVDAGILLPRTKQIFADTYQHYIVYELDGAIRACSALIPYNDGQMEIAAVAVDRNYSHIGIGPKMMDYLVSRAKKRGANSVFLLTTQTADWFENLGFEAADISTLPEERKAIWTPGRGSKLLRKKL